MSPRCRSPASAQAAAAAENPAGTEIVVTAQKCARNLQDVLIAMTVVGAVQLEAANINSAEQLFQRVPTLTFRKGDTNKDSGVSIRGVGTISFSWGSSHRYRRSSTD